MIALIVFSALVRAEVFRGRDEFGRACRLARGSGDAVEYEGTWYYPAGGRTVRAPGEAPIDLEVFETGGRPTWFRLWPASASGYPLSCRLNREPELQAARRVSPAE